MNGVPQHQTVDEIASAPLALFVYNRPGHARRTIESLKSCDGFENCELTVFCDGPKSLKDEKSVEKTRDVARDCLPPGARIIAADSNKGLSRSIIDGVSEICDCSGQVIVVEDDLLLEHDFITYMNHALQLYKDNTRIMQVSGYMFPITAFARRKTAIFLPLTTSWGWATWKRAWERFDPMASGWERLKRERKIRDAFNVNGAFNYDSMLSRQMAGQIDSWAIRWYWTVFQEQGLVVYPPVSLVNNIGFDGSGTHGFLSARESYDIRSAGSFNFSFPEKPFVDPADLSHAAKFFKNLVFRKRLAAAGGLAPSIYRRFKHLWRKDPFERIS